MGTSVRRGAAILLVSVASIALVEGLASFILVTRAWLHQRLGPSHPYARYDAELGWVPVANFDAEVWRGVRVHINERGFRGARATSAAPPSGRKRVVCSGDSFTFGFGVADDQSWCAQLEGLDPSLETVNLAVPGYGVDQAYLRYRREAPLLRPTVHLFAFIEDDFHRMMTGEIRGYPKPILKLDGERLAIANMPVPQASWSRPLLFAANESSLFRLIDRVRPRKSAPAPSMNKLVDRVMEELARADRASGTRLVAMRLPVLEDYRRASPLRDQLSAIFTRLDIAYIDLGDAFDALSPTQHVRMFLPGDQPHYSAEGSRFVAGEVLQRIARAP